MLRLLLVLSLVSATSAAAQGRAPSDRQTLNSLARTLGESHALRQLCKGAGDQYWRERMKALLVAEQPDVALQDSLESAFNAGYDSRQKQFKACSADSRQAESQVAAKGQALARKLSHPG